MSASIQDPWRLNPPPGLVRHELGHAFSAIYFGAEQVTISHDGHSWRSDPQWPVKNPSANAVAASWLGGTVSPQYMSGEDALICNSIPANTKFEILTELEPIFEKILAIPEDRLCEIGNAMTQTGSITIQHY